MKRYLLFIYPHYYPAGGWNDLVASFNDIMEAQKAAAEYSKDVFYPRGHIVNTERMEIVCSFDMDEDNAPLIWEDGE